MNTTKKKNYHKTETMIIAIAVAAIAVLVPLWFLFLKPTPTPVTQSGPNVTYSLYDHAVYEGTKQVVGEIDQNKIESMHFIKKDSSWGFVYDYVEENYFLDGYGAQIAYDKDYAFTFIRGFAAMGTAQRLVAENVTDFQKYGLNADNENLLTVSVKTTDNKKVEILVGDALLDETGYYATTVGNDKVYTIAPINYGYISCDVHDIMDARITNPFTESEYVPNEFAIYRGRDEEGNMLPFVALKYFSDAAEHEYIKTTVVTYPEFFVPYGASSQYNGMLYDSLRSSIYGERVVDAEKQGESFSEEYLKENYGIDLYDKNCTVLKFYHEFADIGKIENEVWFSPKSADGYYFAYNPGLRTVVKVLASKVSFLDWTAEQFMEPSVYLQDINSVASLSINSTKLQQMYVSAGHKVVDLTINSNTPIDENEQLKVTYNGGKTIPDVRDSNGGTVRSGTDNYRYLFLAMQMVDLHDQLSAEEVAENGIDTSRDADVVITIVTRKGVQHELKFYYYSNGRAYFTYNGGGGYTVYLSTLKLFLQSCEDLVNGVEIPMR